MSSETTKPKSIDFPILIRAANQEDVNFIFNAWLRSFKSSIVNKYINSDSFFNEHHKVVELILKRSETLVACNKDDISQILGFVCAERVDNVFVFHYIYVKQVFRGMGVSDMLLDALGKKLQHEYTHAGFYTHLVLGLMRQATLRNLYYNPYLQMPRSALETK